MAFVYALAGGILSSIVLLIALGLTGPAGWPTAVVSGLLGGVIGAGGVWLMTSGPRRHRSRKAPQPYVMGIVYAIGWMGLAYILGGLSQSLTRPLRWAASLSPMESGGPGLIGSAYLNAQALLAIPAFWGAGICSLFRLRFRRGGGPQRNFALMLLGCFAVLVVLLFPARGPIVARLNASARSASCARNLGLLHQALSLYSEDFDGRLPLCSEALELPGFESDRLAVEMARTVPNAKACLGGGPIWAYAKNAGIFFCPADPMNLDRRGVPRVDRFPEPGISYEWNAGVAGAVRRELPRSEWLLRDRAPWHSGRRNEVHADGHVPLPD